MRTYLLWKSLHILGVILFMGNIIVTGWWKRMADRHGDPKVVAFAQRQVTLTDILFTALGALLIFVSGIAIVMRPGIDLSRLRWLILGFGLFMLSGIIWATVLIPIQIRQSRMAKSFAAGGPIPDQYWRLGRIWMAFGIIAVLLPVTNIFLMIFKPTL